MSSNPTIVAHLQKVVPQALVELCEAGMRESYWAMHDYEVVAYKSRQDHGDQFSFVDLPSSYRTRDFSGVNQGVFQGLSVNKIFAMVFEPDAVTFLVKHAYNQYTLWKNVRDLCNWLFNAPIDQVTLPYTLEQVKERLYATRTPFGVKTSPYTTHQTALLKQAIAAQGGTLDPNKLQAAYAFDLIRLGLVLRVKREEYQAPASLMLNPFWADFVKEVTAEAGVESPDGVSLLVGVGAITGQLKIQPESGFTAQQAAELLTSGRARISGDAVLLPAPAPAEGMSNIAKILDPRPSVTQTGRVFWTVAN